MDGRFFRFVPKGKPLFGWTSETSFGVLPTGFVFAYELEHPYSALEWFDRSDLDKEVVIFTGQGAYDPGDYEGVAVKPVKELSRMTIREWLQHARSVDLANDRSYRLWLDRLSQAEMGGSGMSRESLRRILTEENHPLLKDSYVGSEIEKIRTMGRGPDANLAFERLMTHLRGVVWSLIYPGSIERHNR